MRVVVTWRGPHCNITVGLLESSLPPQTGPVLVEIKEREGVARPPRRSLFPREVEKDRGTYLIALHDENLLRDLIASRTSVAQVRRRPGVSLACPPAMRSALCPTGATSRPRPLVCADELR